MKMETEKFSKWKQNETLAFRRRVPAFHCKGFAASGRTMGEDCEVLTIEKLSQMRVDFGCKDVGIGLGEIHTIKGEPTIHPLMSGVKEKNVRVVGPSHKSSNCDFKTDPS